MTTDVLVSPGESGYDCVMARKKTTKHGGFRKIPLGADVDFHPERAKDVILAAYRLAGANLHRAAGLLDPPVTERTLHRWVIKLSLQDELKRQTRLAQKEGWLDDHRRPSVRKRAA